MEGGLAVNRHLRGARGPGAVVAGTHGAGVNTPISAEVAAATTGFDGVPHMPKVGMFAIGANAWMVAAGVLGVTGVPVGTTASGTGTGGIAIEHVIIAPALTSGGIAGDCTRSDHHRSVERGPDWSQVWSEVRFTLCSPRSSR